MRYLVAILALVFWLPSLPAQAQDDQTLADIRQELSVLYVEIQKLKRELSTTGAPQTATGGDSVLDRVNAIEAELTRLTQQTEQLDFRLQEVVRDGTNRIGDLEFRLVELEGGDVSQLGETTTLGGGVAPQPAPAPAPQQAGDQLSLAVGEKDDYDTAVRALEAGDFAAAADRLANFDAAYPGSPLAAQAHLTRGHALTGMEDTREAARAYLAAFSANPTGPVAPEALLQLGVSLDKLGQTQQACVTLGEIETRFPASAAVSAAGQKMSAMGCS